MSQNMANRPVTVQMAVTSENQDFKGNINKDEFDNRAGSNSPRTNMDSVPKKKGTFKITSVKLNDRTQDPDSMDDLDETHTEMTEDYSSEILDTSKATDYGQDTPSVSEDIPINNQSGREKEKTSDMHSRFRVVKIETKEPFRRGRWLCHDFLDPQPPTTVDKSEMKHEDANSSSSSAGSSIHYVHGVDDPAKNPLLAGASGTIHALIPEGQSTGQDVFQPIHPAPSTAVNPHSQVSAVFSKDVGPGLINTSLCQSHSHQSISSIASIDNIQMQNNVASTGSSVKGEGISSQHSSHIMSSGQNGEGGSKGIFMPHYSSGPGGAIPGSSISLSVYPQAPIQASSQMPSDKILPNQGQEAPASTYQTYVHLGQQIPNPGISQSGHSETMPATEISNGNIPQPVSESTVDMPDTSAQTINGNEFVSGTDSEVGKLGKDLNVIQSPTGLSPLALVAAVGDLQSPEDKSGSSTVAIDNKIEQAMDLVKSHLMFAVREEVEVLKVQIADLIERNNQLEYENGILRAAASSETLAKLQQPQKQLPPPSS